MRAARTSAILASAAIAVGAAGCGSVSTPPRGNEPKAQSAQVAGGITVSPIPGAVAAAPQTEISLRGATAAEVGTVTATGSQSGGHGGRLESYASVRGLSFVPSSPFQPGEQVTVRLAKLGVSYSFTVARPAALQAAQEPTAEPPATTQGAWTFASEASLHPPQVAVDASKPGAPSGDVFLAPLLQFGKAPGPIGQPGALILGSNGQPIWSRPAPAGDEVMDFRPQTYEGAPVLTWWQGRISPLGYGVGEDEIVDSSYRTVATVHAGNGLQADLHEFELTSRGTALVTAYRPIAMDLSAYGGAKNGVLLDSVAQEIDIKTGRVILEWDPLDHVSLSDSYPKPTTSAPWDPFHLNSIDEDASGNLLLSMRNTWAANDADVSSGQLKWTLGGKQSSYRLGAGARFAWQHDVRFRSNGQVSVFDDEGSPPEGKQSRSLILSLDPATHTAAVAKAYTHPTALLTSSQGNTQVLANGDVVTGWGAEPNYSAFSPAGELVYDARLPAPDESYRTYFGAWNGTPSAPPAVAVRPGGHGTTVYVSWNGATAVARWQVLAGSSPGSLSPIATAARSGFETAISVPSGARYLAVRALDSGGRTLGTSAAAAG